VGTELGDLGVDAGSMAAAGVSSARLDVLKALGDNTRYAIFLELARSPLPLTTADVADILDLHPNTVRPHLERMRDVGLLRVDTEARGGVGRPQHRYSVAPDAPSLGLEPPTFPALARMLVHAAAAGGIDGEDLMVAGVAEGREDARRWPAGTDCVEAVIVELARMGFDPAAVDHDGGATVAFSHCPFRELAEAHPEVVCRLHCGLISGFIDELGGAEVAAFHSLVDRNPCQVDLTRT
jgi:predicted ArsR family transcriptional regulator